jgi:hypothetical protein
MLDSKTNQILVVAGSILIGMMIAVVFLPKRSEVLVYDCSMTERLPDVSSKVKEACRQIRSSTYQYH